MKKNIIKKYKIIERDIPIYDTEEEIEDDFDEWIVLDGTLYSKKWNND